MATSSLLGVRLIVLLPMVLMFVLEAVTAALMLHRKTAMATALIAEVELAVEGELKLVEALLCWRSRGEALLLRVRPRDGTSGPSA